MKWYPYIRTAKRSASLSSKHRQKRAILARTWRVGSVGGAAMGALIGGPVGAVAGAAIGGTSASVANVEPTEEVTTYVTTNSVDPVYLEGEVVVGAGVPESVTVYDIPSSLIIGMPRSTDKPF